MSGDFSVQFQIDGITDQQPLQAPRFFSQRRQLAQLGFDQFPFGQGVNGEAGVDCIDSDDELAGTTRNELVTIPTRHREAPFGVETYGISSAKHVSASPVVGFPCQLIPLLPTSYHFCTL